MTFLMPLRVSLFEENSIELVKQTKKEGGGDYSGNMKGGKPYVTSQACPLHFYPSGLFFISVF